jgi:hypothetical protein
MGNITLSITEEALASTGGDYSPIPEGSYNATIFNVVSETVKSGDNAGKPRFNIQFKISDAPYANRRVFSYVPLYVAKDFWKTKAFFSSLGIDMSVGKFTVPEPNDLLGKPIGVRVKIGTDQNGQPRNEVAGFDKSTEGAESLLASLGATPVGDVWA